MLTAARGAIKRQLGGALLAPPRAHLRHPGGKRWLVSVPHPGRGSAPPRRRPAAAGGGRCRAEHAPPGRAAARAGEAEEGGGLGSLASGARVSI